MVISRTKFFQTLLIVVLIMSFLPVSSVFATESNGTVTGKAGLLFQHNFTDKEKDEFVRITEGGISQYDGWSLEDNKIKRFYPAHTGEVKINGKIIDVNLDGTFKANNIPVGTAEIELKFEQYDVVTKEIEVIANSDNNVELFIDEDLEEMLLDMDDNEGDVDPSNNSDLMSLDPGGGGGVGQIDKHGQKGIVGWYVHCNRFNGPNGNYTYYSKSSWQLPQAIQNFIGSDCDYAMIKYRCTSVSTMSKCKGLRYYNGNLNSNPTNCSTAIGKSTRFHY